MSVRSFAAVGVGMRGVGRLRLPSMLPRVAPILVFSLLAVVGQPPKAAQTVAERPLRHAAAVADDAGDAQASFAAAVESLNPSGFWPLQETSGSTAADAVGPYDGTIYEGSTGDGVSLGLSPGPLPDSTYMAFDGDPNPDPQETGPSCTGIGLDNAAQQI